jgi:hypothetical protein
MATFMSTTKEKGHTHLIFLDDLGIGITSRDNKHRHDVGVKPEEQAEIETIQAMKLQGILPPDAPEPSGELIIFSADGHTHDFAPQRFSETTSGESGKSEDDWVSDVQAKVDLGEEYQQEFKDNGDLSIGYYDGTQQWSSDDKSNLQESMRAAITLNKIEPLIDLLVGFQRQNKLDIKYLPVEGGDQVIADIYNLVSKNITEATNYDYEQTIAFRDSAIVGRGLLNTKIRYDRNPLGDIVIEHYPWDEVVFGEHDKLDLGDCEFIAKTKWLSRNKVEGLWPKKAKNIIWPAEEDKGKTREDPTAGGVSGLKWVDGYKKRVKAVECWIKEFEQVHVVMNHEEEVFIEADDWTSEDISKVKTIEGFTVIPIAKTFMRVVKIAGNVLISNEIDDNFDTEFPIVPVYAKKMKNKIWGKVEGMKGIQEEINKRHSQIIDIVNKMINWNWLVGGTTFDDENQKEEFIRNSSTPGAVLTSSDPVNNPPVKLESSGFPTGIANLEQLSTQTLREISNINAELQGISTRAESGVAIAEKKRQSMLGNEFLYDNLSLANRLEGRILLKLIPKVWTPERILRLVEDSSQGQQGLTLGGREFVGQQQAQDQTQISSEDVMRALEDTDISKFDVVVTESRYTPTVRQENLSQFIELARVGAPIPTEIFIEFFDIPEEQKKTIMASITAQREREQHLEEGRQQTEITKTQIANQEQGLQ